MIKNILDNIIKLTYQKNFELISQLKPFNTSLKNNSFFYKKNDNKIKNSYKVSNIWEPSNLDGDIIFIN